MGRGSHGARSKEDVSEVIYGTITLLALVLVLEEHPETPWQVVGALVAAALALAVARAYAGVVAETLSRRQPLKRAELRTIWREARPVMVYAQLPTLVFVLSALGLFPLGLAFWIAEAAGLFILLLAGYLVGRRVGSSRLRSLFSSLVIGGAGALIIVLKILTH